MNYKKIALIILSMFVLFNCSSKKSIFKNYGDIAPVRDQANSTLEGWQNFYFSKKDCQCVYGGEFYIAFKEASSQSNNLMISLQGGGACWPGMIECKSEANENDVLISNFTNELEERLKDNWNQVVIPYCDGSIYMGDTQQDYNSDNEVEHWHDGLKISVASLTLTKKKFPKASKIFLTGCSAGGYGTIIQLRLIRELYPKASIFVLNESGPGLLRPDTEFWNMLDTSWNLNQLVPDNCEECEGQLLYWYDEMLKDPLIKIGLYSSYQDYIIGKAFLGMSSQEYQAHLLKTTGNLHSKYPNQFKRFFINGQSHCVENRDYEINGMKYWDWVLAFVNENENWKDMLE